MAVTFFKPLQSLALALRDMVYPPKCRLCGRFAVNRPANLSALNFGRRPRPNHALFSVTAPNICRHCLAKLQVLPLNSCQICGCVPVNGLCINCVNHPAVYITRCMALLDYNPAAGELIKRFKYGGDLYLGRVLSFSLLAAFIINAQNGISYDIITPVPLHPKKLKARKFNQNLRLLQYWPKLGVYQLNGLQNAVINPNLLARKKHTRPQAGLNVKARLANVADAFYVQGNASLNGLNILLVDDIVTTGATSENCAKALKQSGANRVDVISVARTMPHLNPGHLMEI